MLLRQSTRHGTCKLYHLLFDSLLAMRWSRLILENSGVAEPHNIRDRFEDAIADGHPITGRVVPFTFTPAWLCCAVNLNAVLGACSEPLLSPVTYRHGW